MRGHLTRRGERSWRLKYDLAANGKRETRYVTLQGTRKQAQAQAAKILADVATGQHVDPSTETVGAFIERWLRDWAEINVGNATYTRYAGLLRGKPLYLIALLLLATGLRRGEALALRWRDIDLMAGTAQVVRAFEQTKRGGLVVKEPKSKHGRRTVTLPVSTVTELCTHKKAQQELRLFLGIGGKAELVFDHPDGSPLSPDIVTHQWAAAMKAANLKATLHSLRHSHASTLLASGLDVLTIARRLGHADAVLVLRTYGHLIKPDDRAAAIMEQALKG